MQDIGEECTSGEEVWGTPTSGENDEMQMFNSDQTHSVNFIFCSFLFGSGVISNFPSKLQSKSSSSLTGDDDTELMMDELLMAPPMTASTIRGLLPR